MKNRILFMLALILVSCTTDDNKPIIENELLLGTWKVIEQLVDPGDGSGTFQPVSYHKTVDFFSNGTVTSNGYLCFISEESVSSSGTFEFTASHESDTNFDGRIKPNNCEFSETEIYFNLTSDNKLILWYPCFEGCAEKYEKIQENN